MEEPEICKAIQGELTLKEDTKKTEPLSQEEGNTSSASQIIVQPLATKTITKTESTGNTILNIPKSDVEMQPLILPKTPTPPPLNIPTIPAMPSPLKAISPPPLPPLMGGNPDLDNQGGTNVEVQKEGDIVKDKTMKDEIDSSQAHDISLQSAIDDLDNDIPDTLYAIDDLAESHNDEPQEAGDGEGEKKIIRTRPINTAELGCCEYCGGPVKKRRQGSLMKRYCSKACARSCKILKFKREEQAGNSLQTAEPSPGPSTSGSSTTIDKRDNKLISWNNYLPAVANKAAPDFCFKHTTRNVPGLQPGMKLEAFDRNNPESYCVATVVEVVGHRVCIRYDGYGTDSSNDVWCNFQAEELHPIGWCSENGYPLQPPKGVNSSLEAWKTFLTATLTGAIAAPEDLFKKAQEHFQPRVHGFEVGMKLEAIHPLRPSVICPATVTKSLGPYYFAVTPDFQHDIPTITFCCHSDSPGIFPIGWCYRNGIEMKYPANYTKKTFSWSKYLSVCRATAAPSQSFKKCKTHKFRVGHKVEAVDLEQPAVICVATVANVIGRLLFLFFDGQSRFQFVDVDSPNIYPIGWCKRTGHSLVTPFGYIKVKQLNVKKLDEKDLPSFDEVIARQWSLAILPKKSIVRKERDKDDLKGIDFEDKSGDSDISEDDPLIAERYHHNKNQIFFNKGCCIGPLLNPDQVKLLPDATPPGKVSTVIRTGLEMVAQAALDPEKVIDLMQEGCGVRVTIKHQGKLLKKAISRVDSRPKLERYLKRFCRRLICCEYFLSLKRVGQPCPDQCKSDDQGNLQGPKGLKAKRSREYFEVKHLGFEKKKRGRRRRKSELLTISPQGVVMKASDGTPLPASVLPSSIRNRQLAPAYHIQPNGSSFNRPAVASTALPGVQAPVVRYQGPGNVAVVRPNTNLQLPVRSHGNTAIAPAQPPQIVIGSLPAGQRIAKQDGPIAKGRTLIMTADSGGPNKPKIVTNVSSQRFATSSSGGGTTITFGRAPPNVTVCSSLTPPPLTRISDTVESITAELGCGGSMSSTPKSVIGSFNLSHSTHMNASRGPPNVVVSSQGIVASGGNTQALDSNHQYASGNNPVGGVVRAPIVIPPQVKQETPPPPPLVHSSKVSNGVRLISPAGTVVPSTKVSLVPSSYTQVPSYSQRSFTSPTGQTLYKLGSHTLSPKSPSKRAVYIRPGNVKSETTGSYTHTKHILPNYPGLSPRISPKTTAISNEGTLSESTKVTMARHAAPLFQTIGQKTRTIIPAKRAIQTVHHNPNTSRDNISFRPHVTSSKPSSQQVQNVTLEKVRAGIKSKAIHEEYHTNDSHIIKQEQNTDKLFDMTKSDSKVIQKEQCISEASKNERELWWIDKKTRRKRSRLTYMGQKKEDGLEVGEEFYLSDEDLEDPALFSEYHFDYPERPKRGRIGELNDFVMRLEDEETLAMTDEQDPDWDESMEGKKMKSQVKTKRKGFGRPRKEDGSEVSSPTLSNPPSPKLPSPPNLQNTSFVRHTNTTKNIEPKPTVLRLEPAPPRRPVSVAVGNDNIAIKAGKYPRSYSTADGSHRPQQQSTSSITSPTSPKSPPIKRRRMVDVGVNTSLPGCISGRSPDLPSNPLAWTVDHVIQYILSTDCGHYAVIFKEEEIDGHALLMLSRDALMQFTPMKLGPTLKMCSYISQLRLRAK